MKKNDGSTGRKTGDSRTKAPARAKRKPGPTRDQIKDAQARGHATLVKLKAIHPDAHCELDHRTPFQLLVATVLSAQTTDVLVNKVTNGHSGMPGLFELYPDAKALGAAEPETVAKQLRERGLGMHNTKAKNIVGLARKLVEKHGAEVPRTLAELVELPGVGRKTANVVLGVAWGTPEGVVVDTHVQRISQRLGWTRETEPPEIEQDLMKIFPQSDWDVLAHTLIFHGRRVCYAIKPSCATCGVSADCPSAFKAENVGRKPPRTRT